MRGPLACALAWLWLCAQPSPAEARCGDGKVDVSIRRTCAPCARGSTNCPCADVREPLEPCDGRDLDGATCQSQGFFGGTLRCTRTCKLDTSRCTSPTSDLKLLHRTIGPAPAPASASASLAFATNVISVGTPGARATSIVPYNWDLRGPWGKASKVPGAAAVISSDLALARAGTSLELVQHDYQGGAKAVHAFGDRTGLAWTKGFRGGALIALAGGGGGRGSSELVRVEDTGKVRPAAALPGVVQALSWHHEGFVAVYVHEDDGDLRVAWLDDAGVVKADRGLGAPPASVAIAPLHPMRAVVVRGAADRVTATIVTFDARKGIAVEKELRLLSSGARVVAAGYAGSVEGNFVVLDDGKGTIHAARIHGGKAKTKRVLTLRGAVAYAATTGYQRVYVAWSHARQLHLTSFSAFLE